MVRLGDDLIVVTPIWRTSSGSRGKARCTRFCTSVSACVTLVPILKVTVRIRLPSDVDCDDMYSMLSTPLICCSSGVATVSAMTLGLAPGNCALTTTDGGTTSGYSEIGNWNIAISPTRKMKTEITPAKIGRSIKNLERCIGGLAF